MNVQRRIRYLIIIYLLFFSSSCGILTRDSYLPGKRVLLDAHNCYPYQENWSDRIDRALNSGIPLAIEQDLVWYTDSTTGISRSIVSHGKPFTGTEPSLKQYFFERIRPFVEGVLRNGSKKKMPLIILNLEFKNDVPEHHRAVWEMLGEYEGWLCMARRTNDINTLMPLDVKPVLILTGSTDLEQASFHDSLKQGERLKIFGSIHTGGDSANLAPQEIALEKANNYRRWWNNPWKVVETDGQQDAGEWTKEDMVRLKALVDHAHNLGLWIRFYTLNGYAPDAPDMGWSEGYNFGSIEQVKIRWKAAIECKVDFIATDQYEELGEFLSQH